jgi:hypothetical protein
MRAGDDFKLALTVYTDDSGTVAQVAGSRSQIALWPDRRGPHSWDYGLGWLSGATHGPGFPAQFVPGVVTPVRAGGINFSMSGSVTSALCHGRYRLSVQIDLYDGEFCMVEGILQVRERWERPGLGHVPLTAAQLAALVPPPVLVDGRFVDADGFFLATSDFYPGPRSPDFTTDFEQDFPHA